MFESTWQFLPNQSKIYSKKFHRMLSRIQNCAYESPLWEMADHQATKSDLFFIKNKLSSENQLGISFLYLKALCVGSFSGYFETKKPIHQPTSKLSKSIRNRNESPGTNLIKKFGIAQLRKPKTPIGSNSACDFFQLKWIAEFCWSLVTLGPIFIRRDPAGANLIKINQSEWLKTVTLVFI